MVDTVTIMVHLWVIIPEKTVVLGQKQHHDGN